MLFFRRGSRRSKPSNEAKITAATIRIGKIQASFIGERPVGQFGDTELRTRLEMR